jgi:molybdopterin-guanine dinucleotide biosynthesis protein A
VRNSSDGYPELPPGVLQTGDLFPGMGPLAGIHAGLGCCSSEAAFCAACDMPFLTVGFIWRLIRRFRQLDCDVLLPRVAGEVEPLAAIYRRCLRGMMERILSDGQGSSIRRLFPVVNTAYFDLPDTSASRRLFTNLNTPEDMVRVCGA